MKIIKTKSFSKFNNYIWDYKGENGKRALYEGNIANGSDTTFHRVVRVVFHDSHLSILTDEGKGMFVKHSITLIDKD